MCIVQSLSETKASRELDTGEQLECTKPSLRCPAHPHNPRAYHRKKKKKKELKHNKLLKLYLDTQLRVELAPPKSECQEDERYQQWLTHL